MTHHLIKGYPDRIKIYYWSLAKPILVSKAKKRIVEIVVVVIGKIKFPYQPNNKTC
jgi:hypothetical protein